MANSYIEYTSGLTGTTFSVPFKYISIDDVQALGFDGEKYHALTIASRDNNAKTITLDATPSTYAAVRLYRASAVEQLVDFQNGSRLSERDLDTAYQQGLFAAQEVAEDANTVQFQSIREGNLLGSTNLVNFASSVHTGDNTTTVFNLSFNPRTTVPEAFVVSIDGVLQSPTDAYTLFITPAQITFTAAPPAGSKIVVVTAASAASATSVDDVTIGLTNTNQVKVKDGAVSEAKIADGAVTPDKLSTGGPSWDSTGIIQGSTFRAAQGVPNSADSSTTGFAFGPDGDTGMFSEGTGNAAGGPIAFYTNGESIAGIYRTPGGTKTLKLGDFDSSAQLWLQSNNSGFSQIAFGDTGDDDVGVIRYSHSDNSLKFIVNAVERMRIDSGGRVLVGLTTPPTSIPNSICCSGRIVTQNTYSQTTSSSANVYINSDGLLFRTTSSARYKENINDYDKGIEAIKSLRPVTYQSVNEDEDSTYAGFIAEEVHDAGLNEFVEYNKEGKPDALHYAHMTAVLTKALQEAVAKIESLESRVDALENA